MYNFLRWLVGVLFKCIYPIQVKNSIPSIPQNTNFIIAANHSSILDPVLLALLFPDHHIRFLGKKELFNTPIKKKFFKSVGVIAVDRSKQDIKAIKDVIRILKNNKILGIFPHGTRISNDDQQQIKNGISFFSLKTASPILCLHIEGGYRLRKPVSVTAYPIIYPSLEKLDRKELDFEMEQISNRVRDYITGGDNESLSC